MRRRTAATLEMAYTSLQRTDALFESGNGRDETRVLVLATVFLAEFGALLAARFCTIAAAFLASTRQTGLAARENWSRAIALGARFALRSTDRHGMGIEGWG